MGDFFIDYAAFLSDKAFHRVQLRFGHVRQAGVNQGGI
jgi:hypothetical protein